MLRGEDVGFTWTEIALDPKMLGAILDGIIGSCDPEVLIDKVSNLSSMKETVLLLGLLFLQTDLPFEMGIMDDLIQG